MRFSLEQKSHFSPFLIIQLHGMHSTLCCIISTAVLQRNSGTQWPAAAIGCKCTAASQYLQQESLSHTLQSPPPPQPRYPNLSHGPNKWETRRTSTVPENHRMAWVGRDLKDHPAPSCKVATHQIKLSRASFNPALNKKPGMRHPYLLFYPPHLSGGAACTLSEGALWFHSLCHW